MLGIQLRIWGSGLAGGGREDEGSYLMVLDVGII